MNFHALLFSLTIISPFAMYCADVMYCTNAPEKFLTPGKMVLAKNSTNDVFDIRGVLLEVEKKGKNIKVTIAIPSGSTPFGTFLGPVKTYLRPHHDFITTASKRHPEADLNDFIVYSTKVKNIRLVLSTGS